MWVPTQNVLVKGNETEKLGHCGTKRGHCGTKQCMQYVTLTSRRYMRSTKQEIQTCFYYYSCLHNARIVKLELSSAYILKILLNCQQFIRRRHVFFEMCGSCVQRNAVYDVRNLPIAAEVLRNPPKYFGGFRRTSAAIGRFRTS